MKPPTVRRIAAAVTGALLPLLAAAPAFAASSAAQRDKLGIGAVILIFVVVPVGVFTIITLLVVAPSLLRRPRYRPGRPWNHDPVWFAGPDDPESALRAARPGATARGGASADW